VLLVPNEDATSLNIINDHSETALGPLIGGIVAATVTTIHVAQPALEIKEIVAVPADTPVILSKEEPSDIQGIPTVTTEVLLLLHVPSASFVLNVPEDVTSQI